MLKLIILLDDFLSINHIYSPLLDFRNTATSQITDKGTSTY